MHAVADLVNFVEHHDAAARARPLERLDDVARQCAHVGAPMPAQLGLIVHTAQRNPHKLALQRLGDGLPQRRLAYPRRADQAQDGAMPPGLELANREELKNSLFDFFQAEVIGIEHGARVRYVNVFRFGCLPGQFDQPVEVGAQRRVFCRGLGNAFQPLELLVRLCGHFFGHASGCNHGA